MKPYPLGNPPIENEMFAKRVILARVRHKLQEAFETKAVKNSEYLCQDQGKIIALACEFMENFHDSFEILAHHGS